jgi:hypothetical protein
VAISAGLLAAGVPHRSRPSRPPAPTVAAAVRFIGAWRAHLSASWSVDEVERRARQTGQSIGFQLHEAQRPPDSVFVGASTVSARRGQTLIACATPLGATAAVCREAPTTQTWAEGVTSQIAVLTAAVTGPRAIYRVTDLGGNCYRLSLISPTAALPVYIDRGATYCFDTRTNAVRLSVIQRVGAVDTTTAVTVHAPANDADLALPVGARYERASREATRRSGTS